jgi:DNA-binding transcriptional regulator YdaS (Cro superfamily)
MTKEQVIKHFGSASNAARALRINRSAICHWPSGVQLSARVAFKIELVTQGALKVDEEKGGQ